MSTTLLVTLGLSVPLAVLAWIGALAVDRAKAGLGVRRAVWTMAFIVPLVLAPLALAIRALGLSAAVPASQPIESDAPLAAHVQAIPPEAPLMADPGLNWTVILLAILAIGAGVRLFILLGRGLSLARIARRAEPLPGDFAGMTARLYGGEAPILVGLAKPVVLVPRALAETLTPEQIALICAHERAHLRAGDHIANLLEAIAMATFWFNPVLGAIRAGLSAVREEACDGAVLTAAERPTRRVYAEVLLTAIRHAGGVEPAVAFTGLYRARSARRLRAILMPQGKAAKGAAVIAAVVGLVLAGAAGGLSFAFAGSEPAAPTLAPAPPLQRIAPSAPAPETAPLIATPSPIRTAGAAAPETPVPPQPAPAARAIPRLADLDTMNALRKLLVNTRVQRIEIRARLQTLDGIDPRDWPELRNNDDYKRLLRDRDERVEAYKTLRASYAANYPSVVRAQEQIEQVEAGVNRQVELVRSDMVLELGVLDAKEVAIREQLASMSAATMAADIMARPGPTLP